MRNHSARNACPFRICSLRLAPARSSSATARLFGRIAPVGAPRVNTDAAIAEALRLSGMEQAISQFGDPSLYLSLMQQKQLTPQQAAEVRRMVMQSMRPERFQRAVAASLKNGYPAASYPQLLQMLRSPLARRMTALELAQPDPKSLQAFAAAFNQNPPAAQHVAAVNRIDQATGSSQLTVDVVAAVLEGMAAGSAGQLPPAQAQAAIDEVRGQHGDVLRQAAMLRMLYQYRGVPDDQLNQYADLLSSPAAFQFNQVAARGLLEATRQASAELMGNMLRRFPAKAPQQQ